MTDPEAAEELLDRLYTLTVEELRLLRAVWDEGDPDLRVDIWANAKSALVSADGWEVYESVQEAVHTWVNDYATGRSGTYLDFSMNDQDRLDLRIAAVPPILDAAVALLCGGELAEVEREMLMEPWLVATDSDPAETAAS